VAWEWASPAATVVVATAGFYGTYRVSLKAQRAAVEMEHVRWLRETRTRVYLEVLVTANIIGARAQDFDVRMGESDAVLADSSHAGVSAFGSTNVNAAWVRWFRAVTAAENAHRVNSSHDSQMAKGHPPEPSVAGLKSKLNDSLMPAEIHAREALVKTIRDELAVDGNDKSPRLGRWKRLRSRFTHL